MTFSHTKIETILAQVHHPAVKKFKILTRTLCKVRNDSIQNNFLLTSKWCNLVSYSYVRQILFEMFQLKDFFISPEVRPSYPLKLRNYIFQRVPFRPILFSQHDNGLKPTFNVAWVDCSLQTILILLNRQLTWLNQNHFDVKFNFSRL